MLFAADPDFLEASHLKRKSSSCLGSSGPPLWGKATDEALVGLQDDQDFAYDS